MSPALPVTIDLFSANALPNHPLDLTREVTAIKDELHEIGLSDVIDLRHHAKSSTADLQRVLLDHKPTIVQFSGHGRPEPSPSSPSGASPAPAGILLHDEDSPSPVPVSGKTLDRLFGGLGHQPRLVLLNACHSQEQAAAILGHVDFVIGISGKILDDSARAFSVAFYRALAFGSTIQRAFDLGVNAIMLAGLSRDIERPKLGARDGADPSTVTLAPAPKGKDATSWDVYLGYTRSDRDHVHPLAVALEQRKIRVFFDEWERGPGNVGSRMLEEGLDASDHGILAISPASLEDAWLREQYAVLLDNAVTQGCLLIPVLVGEGSPKLPPFLRIRQPADLRGKSGEAWNEVLESIVRALRGRRPPRE